MFRVDGEMMPHSACVALPATSETKRAHWISYVLVPDVDEAANQAVILGGTLVKSAEDIPGTVRPQYLLSRHCSLPIEHSQMHNNRVDMPLFVILKVLF
jgi:hypothetical protein